MSAMARAELVLTLALASLGRLPDRPCDALVRAPQSGHAVVAIASDGALLVETDRGLVVLVLASDALIRGRRGPLTLDDIRCGDLLEWSAEDEHSVSMIDELRVTPRGLYGA